MEGSDELDQGLMPWVHADTQKVASVLCPSCCSVLMRKAAAKAFLAMQAEARGAGVYLLPLSGYAFLSKNNAFLNCRICNPRQLESGPRAPRSSSFRPLSVSQ